MNSKPHNPIQNSKTSVNRKFGLYEFPENISCLWPTHYSSTSCMIGETGATVHVAAVSEHEHGRDDIWIKSTGILFYCARERKTGSMDQSMF